MHPTDCPKWEYSDIENSEETLKKEISSILVELRKGGIDSLKGSTDTRDVHYQMFRSLAPRDTSYYAGHYRGEDFRCLKYIRVRIGGDPRVGFPPNQVPGCMAELSRLIKGYIASIDQRMKSPNAKLPQEQKVLYAVTAVCKVFELLLRIHPYVNGNGHAARFCIWSMLGRYGLWPTNFPIEPRPKDPPYTDSIIEYRNGNPYLLEMFILGSLYSGEK